MHALQSSVEELQASLRKEKTATRKAQTAAAEAVAAAESSRGTENHGPCPTCANGGSAAPAGILKKRMSGNPRTAPFADGSSTNAPAVVDATKRGAVLSARDASENANPPSTPAASSRSKPQRRGGARKKSVTFAVPDEDSLVIQQPVADPEPAARTAGTTSRPRTQSWEDDSPARNTRQRTSRRGTPGRSASASRLRREEPDVPEPSKSMARSRASKRATTAPLTTSRAVKRNKTLGSASRVLATPRRARMASRRVKGGTTTAKPAKKWTF